MSLYQTITRLVRGEVAALPTAELGVVQEQHPHASESDTDNYACTVALRNSGIVLKRVPVATSRVGVAVIPPVGTLVVVQFVGGDVNAPVVTGCLYSEADRPPVNDDGQAVLHLPLEAGDDEAVHAMLDSGDRRQLTLRLGAGLSLRLADDDPAVELSVGDGRAVVTVERDGAVTVESQHTLTLKGNQVRIEAQSQLVLKGATVEIN